MMIKKSELKSTFEFLVRNSRTAFFGFRKLRINTFSIELSSATKNVVVSLYALSAWTDVKVCLARSYPMSYQAAYRLVCSL